MRAWNGTRERKLAARISGQRRYPSLPISG
jgi:hypothetical protein